MNDSESHDPAPSRDSDASLQGFSQLRVWQSAMDLTESVYRITPFLPKHETYGMISQMQRASVSVAANIAEGHTRPNLGEYLHLLGIARASSAELETYLELSNRWRYAPQCDLDSLLDHCAVLGRRLNSLRNALQARR
ncbi:MAG: four helix bundle protein [Thermomicrobiales bacterium]